MSRGVRVLVVGLVAVCWPVPAPPAPAYLPEVREIRELDVDGAVVYAMRADDGRQAPVGLAVVCVAATRYLEVAGFFGPFPAGVAVQLVIIGPGGSGKSYGDKVVGSLAAGFHSPKVTAPSEAREAMGLALQKGSLVMNGFRGFRNAASKARNEEVVAAVEDCLEAP